MVELRKDGFYFIRPRYVTILVFRETDEQGNVTIRGALGDAYTDKDLSFLSELREPLSESVVKLSVCMDRKRVKFADDGLAKLIGKTKEQ